MQVHILTVNSKQYNLKENTKTRTYGVDMWLFKCQTFI